MRSPARLALLPLLALAFAGCDAGNRAAPGSDNALGAPTVTLSTPYEGQSVVVSRQGAPVLAKFDVTGLLGRGAGSTLRYRLDAGETKGAWVAVANASVAVPLGALQANDGVVTHYTLTVQVLDKSGEPWTRQETTGTGEAAIARTLNPQSTLIRTFKVANSWE